MTHEADLALLLLIQRPASFAFDLAASLATYAGDASVTAGLALGLTVARWRTRRAEAWAPLAIALTVVAEILLKLAVPHATPPDELDRNIFHDLPTPRVGFLANSFPSGHVARFAFLLAVTNIPAAFSVVAVVLMAIARVYVADHWPTDVIGGALLGAGVAWPARGAQRSP